MCIRDRYIIATVGEELTLSLRQDVSAKLNRLPLRYFDGHKTCLLYTSMAGLRLS